MIRQALASIKKRTRCCVSVDGKIIEGRENCLEWPQWILSMIDLNVSIVILQHIKSIVKLGKVIRGLNLNKIPSA